MSALYTGYHFVPTWKVIWYDVNSNCTELKFWCTKYHLHLRLSTLPVITPTHLLLLRCEYLFTLRRRGTETYLIYHDPLSRLAQCSAVPLQKSSWNHPLLCVNMWFFMSAPRPIRYSVNIAWMNKGILFNKLNTHLTCSFHCKPKRMHLFVVYFSLWKPSWICG